MTYKPTGPEIMALVGNPDVYAVQHDDGSWTPVREPLTPKVIARHRKGDITVGTYIGHATKVGTVARTLVFDIDNPDYGKQQLDELTALLDSMTLIYGVEWSGRKGWHVWVVAEDYLPAATLYRLGRGIRDELDLEFPDWQFGKMEVFPKQTEVRDLGNLVKLPGGIHRVTRAYNDFVSEAPLTNDNIYLSHQANQYPEVGVRSKGGAVAAVEYPCVHRLQDGVQEGGRNTHLFHLAVMLRKFSLNDENVERIVRSANTHSEPPLEEAELETILDNSRFSGPLCDQIDGDYHCGEQCIKAKHPGLFTRSGALRYAADGEQVVVTVKSRKAEGTQVELEHPDIQQSRAILNEPPRRKND